MLITIFGLVLSACAPAPELAPTGTDFPQGNQLPPDVRYILALQDLPIYGGQDVQYGVIGSVYAGQIAGVIGRSTDGKWWQVGCPGDSVDGCWVTAHSEYTEPLEPPG